MKISQSKDKLILLIILAVVQAIILVWVGIYTKEEAVKYIDEGAYFLQHHTFSQPKYLFYSTYVAINSFFRLTGIGVVGVYISQLLINGVATICFYCFNLHISSNREVSFLATLLLILCVPFQKWTAYLFTESIFFSLIIIYLYVLFVPAFPARVRFVLSFLLFILIIE